MEEKTKIEEIMEENRRASQNMEDDELLEAFARAVKRRKAEELASFNQDQADSELIRAFEKGQKRRSQVALNISADDNMQITIGNNKASWLDHYVGDVASVTTAGFLIIATILHFCGLL